MALRPPTRWVHRLALLTAFMTFFMIVVGGLVTTKQAGDSEPEWSLRFWEWFRSPSELPGGLLYEVTHRMVGTVVGFLTIALVILIWRSKTLQPLRRLVLLALVGVCIQGLLGGFRVRLVASPWLQNLLFSSENIGAKTASMTIVVAIVHAALAQAVFCLMAILALLTSPGWLAYGPATPSADASTTRRFCWLATGAVFCQLVLGAWVRHTGYELAILLHLAGAMGVVAVVVVLISRVNRVHADQVAIRQPGSLLTFLIGFQILLGGGAWVARYERAQRSLPIDFVTTVRTAHVAVGALILMICTLLTARVYRLLRPNGKPGEETVSCSGSSEVPG